MSKAHDDDEALFLRPTGVSSLFATVAVKIEGEDTLVIYGALEHFRVAQGANGVVIAGASVLLHAGA